MKDLIIVFIILAFGLTGLKAQKQDAVKGVPPEKKTEVQTFKPVVKFKVNTFFNTKITESTRVVRTYPDSTTREYHREITYYTTTNITESPSKGFQTISLVVDSLNYKFSEGEAVFEFNSFDLHGKALKFKDLNFKTVTLGRDFDIIYSPYGEIAKVQSAEIEETINYTKEKGQGLLTDVEMFIWTDGLSMKHLTYLGDSKKIQFPNNRIAVDSVWKSNIALEINGYHYTDTLDLKIKEYNAGIFTIEGQSTALKHDNEKILTYDVADLVKIKETKGAGSFKMLLKATGVLESTEYNYEANSKIQIGPQEINENIKSAVKWEITGIYGL